jgi:hypothetical protein
LKTCGERNQLKQLTEAGWKGEINDGWRMTALAVRLLGGEQAFRGSVGNLSLFMVIHDLKV